MSKQPEHQTTDAQTLLNQGSSALLAALESLPVAQLELYLHEVEWMLIQFEEISCGEEGKTKPYQQEMYERFSSVEQQVFAIRDALMLERARRSSIHLQGLILGCGKNGGIATI